MSNSPSSAGRNARGLLTIAAASAVARTRPFSLRPMTQTGTSGRGLPSSVPAPTEPRGNQNAADPVTVARADQDVPSAERWLKLMFISLVPLALGVVLPKVMLIPLSVLSGVLFLASLVLFARRTPPERSSAR
jgi:hypothetical protein